jgi:SPP1 gp7 family putative phage head morphogenesis protein
MAEAVSDLQRETDAFRQRLIAMDRQASAVLSQSFSQVLDGLEPRLQSLERQIAERLAAGETVSADWLFKQDRYRTLIRETNQLMTQYGAVTQTVTTAAQQAAVRASLAEAGRELMAVSGGSDVATLAAGWAAIPEQSIINMVGALQSSTPLGQLFASFGSDAVKDVNRALVQGLALGLGPRQTARTVRDALNISRARAETIVRTEVMRASRQSLAAAFEDSGVVVALRWSSARSPRTCGYCLSQHGRKFPLGSIMATHPACRCTWSPVVADADEWESGESWLRSQPLPTQQSVLGIAAGLAFAAGEVALSDFAVIGFDQRWGPVGNVGSLAQALRNARR